MTEKELKVLGRLARSYYTEDEWGALGFAGIMHSTGLDRKQVRRACRSLAKKGYTKYERVLWNDDGPAGAGYRATKEGKNLFKWCDHEYCDEIATQEDDGYKTCDAHSLKPEKIKT